MAMATPMPSSAPSVVRPPVDSKSPSRTHSMGSRAKSCSTPGAFSHTMSRCAWSRTPGAASRPGVAVLRTRTLFTASRSASSPRPFAQASTWSLSALSFPLPCGIWQIS